MKKLTLTLLATTILSSQAYAAKEPELYFYPAKTWTVGHASDNSKSCAVQSEFNNGFVLQFDGSEKTVQSFTVNFRQNIFKEGQQYDVSLAVPGKEKRNFSATATGPTMLTIPLQSAGDIYASARDQATIDVGVDENNFRFYLVNFAPAAGSFETCMNTGQLAPAQAPQPVAAPAPAAAPKAQPPVREVSNAIPQGNTAPPPPNASPAEIQTTATLNESIALEQQEAERAGVPIVEISQDNPKATVQEIPYTETVRLGDEVITTSGDLPPQSARPQNAPGANPGSAPYRKRMSEQLAEEMSNDPSLVAIKPEGGPTQKETKAAAAAVESVQQEMVTPPQNEETFRSIEPTAEEQRQASEAARTPIPAAPPVEEKIVEAPKQPEPIKTTELAPHPSSIPSEARAMAAQRPMPAETTIPGETNDPNAPFRAHGEIIKTDKDGKPLQQNTAKQPEPMAEPIKAEAAPAPIKQAKVVERKQTPEPIVHKETYEMDADFTNLDNVEPASRAEIGAPFSQGKNDPRKADPDMLRKISELEIKIGKLENENSKLNDELQTTVGSAEQERMSIASDNWNLERATMRYNEAERQIKRLGEQVQRERALCAGDKKDLEAQLFDPKITEQQQLARLADLEQKLAQAEQSLEDQRLRYEDRIKILQSHSATQ